MATTQEWIDELKAHLRARARRAHQGARGGVRRLRGGRRGCGAGRRRRCRRRRRRRRPRRSPRPSTSSSPAPATRRSRSSRSSARRPASASRRPRRSSTRPPSPSRRASSATRPTSSRPSSRRPARPSSSSSSRHASPRLSVSPAPTESALGCVRARPVVRTRSAAAVLRRGSARSAARSHGATIRRRPIVAAAQQRRHRATYAGRPGGVRERRPPLAGVRDALCYLGWSRFRARPLVPSLSASTPEESPSWLLLMLPARAVVRAPRQGPRCPQPDRHPEEVLRLAGRHREGGPARDDRRHLADRGLHRQPRRAVRRVHVRRAGRVAGRVPREGPHLRAPADRHGRRSSTARRARSASSRSSWATSRG